MSIFLITLKDLGQHSFEVSQYDNSTSKPRKYNHSELYLTHPVFPLPHSLDTFDQRYLYFCYTPIVNPLKNYMKVKLYNIK